MTENQPCLFTAGFCLGLFGLRHESIWYERLEGLFEQEALSNTYSVSILHHMAGVGAFLHQLELLVECFFSQILLHEESSMRSKIVKLSYSKNAREAEKGLSCQ